MSVHRVVYAPEADAHLSGIYRYLAAEASPATAMTFLERLLEICESLAQHPERGASRFDIRPGLRVLSHRRRITIAYFFENEEVTILGIYVGGQNYRTLLEDDQLD